MTTLADLIRQRRDALGITQAELARLTTTSPPFVSQLISGTRQINNPAHVIAFAHALEVDPDLVWTVMGKPPPDLVEALKSLEHVRTVRRALNIPTPEE